MRLELENGTTIQNPTSSQIAEVLASLDENTGNSFAILSRNEGTYMQTATNSPDGFILEHQAGSIANHFESVENHIPLERVIRAFQAYAWDDDSWRVGFTWRKQDL